MSDRKNGDVGVQHDRPDRKGPGIVVANGEIKVKK